MRLLLDSRLLLVAMAASRRLPGAARELIEDPENQIFVSAASLWEIAIKSALRKRDFDVDVDELRAALPAVPFLELPVRWDHAAALPGLPGIHRDPFDRLLVAQARTEPLVLLTSDPVIARYPVIVRLVG
jgi:PIN domain nuclease of toxin-antitoxin system